MPKLVGTLNRVLGAFNNLSPATQTFIVTLGLVAVILGPIVTVIGGLITVVGAIIPVFGAVAAALGIGLLPAIGVVLAVVAVVGALAVLAYKVYQNWGPIKAWFAGLWQGVKNVFASAWQGIKSTFSGVGGFFSSIWGRVRAIFAMSPSQLWQAFKTGFMAGLTWLVNLHLRFAEIGGNLIAGLIRGFLGGLGRLKHAIVNVASSVKNWFAEKLGIQSPSRV